jgi:serine/threonine protein kinase
MVYRDLKPANILLDGAGRIRLGDFGSAKLIERATHLSKNYQGTPQYQAPEIYDEDSYTEKIDVFSFSLVLYEILVGHPVYPAMLSEAQIMKKVCFKVRADLPNNINDDVKTLITRCWSDSPDKRLSFSEILAELKRIQFQILPDVDSSTVEEFLNDIRRQRGQLKNI